MSSSSSSSVESLVNLSGFSTVKVLPDCVYIYLRVSTNNQNDMEQGKAGLKSQNAACLRKVLESSSYVVGTYFDVKSGRHPEHLQHLTWLLNSALEYSVIVVAAVDRFSRNLEFGLKTIEQLHKRNIRVYSVLEDVFSTDVEFVALLKTAQAFSDAMSSKVLNARERIIKAGGVIGKIPFGFNSERNAEGIRVISGLNMDEQNVVKEMRKLFESGRTLKYIQAALNAAGKFNRGSRWTTNAVKKCLTNPLSNMNEEILNIDTINT